MKKALNLALISILLLAISSLRANATVLSDTEVKSMVVKQVVENYKKYTDAQVVAEVVGLPFQNMTLPNGKISFVVKQNSDKFMARDLEKVLVYVNDKYVKTFNAPITIKAYQNVLVASCTINREREINSSVVKIEKREISNNFDYLLRADSIDKHVIAKKMFVEGEVIDKRFVKVKPDILRNANVTVYFEGDNLTVTLEATALSDGTIGDNICIMNKNYNRIYKGTVIGENRVLVKI